MSVCRICRAGNTTLLVVKNNLLRLVYEKLSDTEFSSEDARLRALCCYCYQKLLRCHTFSQMAQRSEKIFSDVYDKGLKATHEYKTDCYLGMQHNLSVVTLQCVTIDGYEDSQAIMKEEPSLIIDIKEEVITEPDFVEVEFPQNCTNNDSDKGNDVDTLVFNIHAEQTEQDDTMTSTIIKEPLPSIAIKEELNTDPSELLEVEYSIEDSIKNKLKFEEDSHETWNKEEKNLSKINIEQPKRHNNRKPYICNECNRIFYLKSKLISHLRHLHSLPYYAKNKLSKKRRKRKDKTVHENYACNICNKQFNHKANLRCHIRTHTGEKPFPCNECEKTFNRKDLLNLHMRTHTGEKQFACNICDKQFNQKSNFVGHMLIHTGEKQFACQVCDKRFLTKGHLVGHSKTHSSVKPFACNLCDKQFYRNSNLVSHMRTHTGEKPYICVECNRQFKRKEQLVEHVRLHTGEKPYECNVCHKKFGYKGSYVKHRKIHIRENQKVNAV